MALEFITKYNRGESIISSTNNIQVFTPNIISGLVGTNIVLTLSGLSVYVYSGGQVTAHLRLKEITNWEITNPTTLTFHQDDGIDMILNFISNTDLLLGLSIIENGINNL